jgi:hypothetical protein
MILAIENDDFVPAKKSPDFLCLSLNLCFDPDPLIHLDKMDSPQILLWRVGCHQFIGGNDMKAKRPFLIQAWMAFDS